MSEFRKCYWCGKDDGAHYLDCPNAPETLMGKRLSDDPGLTEMKRMEYLMSKAPCIARLNELAAYSAKDDVNEPSAETPYRRPITRGEIDL